MTRDAPLWYRIVRAAFFACVGVASILSVLIALVVLANHSDPSTYNAALVADALGALGRASTYLVVVVAVVEVFGPRRVHAEVTTAARGIYRSLRRWWT